MYIHDSQCQAYTCRAPMLDNYYGYYTVYVVYHLLRNAFHIIFAVSTYVSQKQVLNLFAVVSNVNKDFILNFAIEQFREQ